MSLAAVGLALGYRTLSCCSSDLSRLEAEVGIHCCGGRLSTSCLIGILRAKLSSLPFQLSNAYLCEQTSSASCTTDPWPCHVCAKAERSTACSSCLGLHCERISHDTVRALCFCNISALLKQMKGEPPTCEAAGMLYGRSRVQGALICTERVYLVWKVRFKACEIHGSMWLRPRYKGA